MNDQHGDNRWGRFLNERDRDRHEIDSWLAGRGGTVMAVLIGLFALWTVFYIATGNL